MAFVDFVEEIECFPDRRADRLASIDELAVFADVIVEIIEQFLRDFDADLGHIYRALKEYSLLVRSKSPTKERYSLTPGNSVFCDSSVKQC